MTTAKSRAVSQALSRATTLVHQALGWLGPSVDQLPQGLRCQLRLDHLGDVWRGHLAVKIIPMAQRAPCVFDIELDVRLPGRDVRFDIKPKSQGMLSPFPDPFLGLGEQPDAVEETSLFTAGDVEVDQYFTVVGHVGGHQGARATILSALHAIRQIRRNGGRHEGYVRHVDDHLQVCLSEVPHRRLESALHAMGEIWRLLAKGAIDGFVPLDATPSATGASPGAPVGETRAKPASKKKLPRVKTDVTPPSSMETQREEVEAYLKSEYALDVTHRPRPEFGLTARNELGIWNFVWSSHRQGDFLSAVSHHFWNPDQVQFQISHETLGSHLGKWFRPEIKIGIPSFDNQFFIRTSTEKQLRAFLEDAGNRARLRALPFSMFQLEPHAPFPEKFDRLLLRFRAPWAEQFGAVRSAIDMVERAVKSFGLQPGSSAPIILGDIHRRLSSFAGAQPSRETLEGKAYCGYMCDDFTGSIEVGVPDFETGLTSLEFVGRARHTEHAFELGQKDAWGNFSAKFPRAPMLPNTATSQGFPVTLTRRLDLRGMECSREVVGNLAPTIELLAYDLGSNAFALRLCEGDMRLRIDAIHWQTIDKVVAHILNLWTAVVALH